MFGLSEDQTNAYNKELDEYYKAVETYASSIFEKYLFMLNSVEIKLLLLNTGTAPANDIDIELHFPDGFEIFPKDELPTIKKSPDPPYKPKNRLEFKPMMINPFQRNSSSHISQTINPFDTCKPTIKKNNSCLVSYNLKNLKHNQTFELEPLYAKFTDINEAKGFGIDYKLKISNVPAIIEGQLAIKFGQLNLE